MGGFSTVGAGIPAVDINNYYLATLGKLVHLHMPDYYISGLVTQEVFTDKAVEAIAHDISTRLPILVGRFVDPLNYYTSILNSWEATADHFIAVWVEGERTIIAAEAVNISEWSWHSLRLDCIGSTIKSTRSGVTISTTNTAISSGRFGQAVDGNYAYELNKWQFWRIKDPASPSPTPIAYFEVPLIGSGTAEDPYRAQMPEEITIDWSLNREAKRKYDVLKSKGFKDEEIVELNPDMLSCRVNRLSVTHSSLIKIDRSGRPVEYVALVRIFHQPDRPNYLRPIEQSISAISSLPGAVRLTKDEAIRRAKKLDPDLTDVDLIRIDPNRPNFKEVLRDYVAHRKSIGVREELINVKLVEMYLEEDKGWT